MRVCCILNSDTVVTDILTATEIFAALGNRPPADLTAYIFTRTPLAAVVGMLVTSTSLNTTVSLGDIPPTPRTV